MNTVVERPFKFADRVVVDERIGTVIEANEKGFTVQFARGKAQLEWHEADRVRHYHKEVKRRGR